MSRAPLSEDAVTQARELIAKGVSVREVARALGCSDTGLRRRLAADPAPAPSSASERARALVARQPDPDAAARAEPAPIDVNQDVRSLVRELLDRTLRISAEAEREGNWSAAQRAMRDAAATLAPLLARLEKLHGEDGEYIKIHRVDVERLMRGMRDRWAAIRERPLLCADCSRELSIAWSEEREPAGGEA